MIVNKPLMSAVSIKPVVAFIDENGFVYARNSGKTNITTKLNGKILEI